MAPRKEAGVADDGAPELNVLGEITLPLDEQEYHLRPSRKAISAIEARLRPLEHLVADSRIGALSITEMAVITAELMHAYGEANPEDPLATDYKGAKPERLADLIFEAAGPTINGRLMVVLMGALTGGYTASGEAKPAKKKTA